MKINNIALIQSGIYRKDVPDGDIVYLQVKDYNQNGDLKKGDIRSYILKENKVENHLLSDGDLLFASKGTSNFCALYTKNIGEAVASSSFFVIKVNDHRIDPRYLCWYLNNIKVLRKLKANAVGSSIPSITKPMLGDLEISIPSIEKQSIIVTLSQLQDKEISLYSLISSKKKQLTNHLLNEIINIK